MKKIITVFLTGMATVTMLGCGSSSSAVSETTTDNVQKEPELKEIELSDKNWRDYFEIAEVTTVGEGMDYYSSSVLTMILKEEYRDKISEDNNSVMRFSFDKFRREVYYATLDGDKVTIGELIDPATFDQDKYGEWREAMDLDLFQDYYSVDLNMIVQGDTLEMTNDSMINGKPIIWRGLQRTYFGGVEGSEDSDVWGCVGILADDLKITDVNGTLYLFE